MILLPTLYKRDTKGKVREWTIQVKNVNDTGAIRTVAGLVDGKKVTSEWKTTDAKNIGKKNSTTGATQADAEAQASWDKKVEKEYFTDVAAIDTYDKFKPMLAHDYTKRPQSSGWSQPKLDGIRCVANANGLWTRNGKAITSCPHIWESVKPFIDNNPGLILDGELYNHELKADFNKITSLVRKVKCRPEEVAEAKELVQYHVYDVYVPEMLFTDRIKVIDGIQSDSVKLVRTDFCSDQEELDKLYSEYTEQGYEGQMVRNNEPYENKRSKHLLKRKEFITEEFKVLRVLEGQGNWAGYAKKFRLQLPDGREFGGGVRGQQAQLKELWESQQTPAWATCRYFELTPDGVPRFPVVIDYGQGMRDD
jgi:ATP-dependent DNA ligase